LLHSANVSPGMFMPIISMMFFFFLAAIAWIFLKKWLENLLFRKANEYQVKAKFLLTKTEQKLFALLKETFPDHEIMAQVDLKQVINYAGGNKKKYMERLGRLSVDFAVYDKNFSLISAIELDDNSHDDFQKQKIDKIKDEAFEIAGQKLVRFKSLHSSEILRRKIEK
jgi:hypothetical protein